MLLPRKADKTNITSVSLPHAAEQSRLIISQHEMQLAEGLVRIFWCFSTVPLCLITCPISFEYRFLSPNNLRRCSRNLKVSHLKPHIFIPVFFKIKYFTAWNSEALEPQHGVFSVDYILKWVIQSCSLWSYKLSSVALYICLMCFILF